MALNEPSICPLLEATARQGYQMALNVACFGAMPGTIPPGLKVGVCQRDGGGAAAGSGWWWI